RPPASPAPDSLPLLPSLTRFPPRPTSSPAALSRRRGPAPAAPASSPAPAPIEFGGRSFRLVCFASLDLRLRFSASRVRSEPRGDAAPPADPRSLPPVPAAPAAEFRRRSIRVLVGLQFHITSASEKKLVKTEKKCSKLIDRNACISLSIWSPHGAGECVEDGRAGHRANGAMDSGAVLVVVVGEEGQLQENDEEAERPGSPHQGQVDEAAAQGAALRVQQQRRLERRERAVLDQGLGFVAHDGEVLRRQQAQHTGLPAEEEVDGDEDDAAAGHQRPDVDFCERHHPRHDDCSQAQHHHCSASGMHEDVVNKKLDRWKVNEEERDGQGRERAHRPESEEKEDRMELAARG
ncbi:hypothetical protein EJB05_29616, partial [Eragrostis curvula]